MKIVKIILHIFAFIFLTILTQIGGIAYLIGLWTGTKWTTNFKGKGVVLFIGLYLLFTFLIVPIIAPIFGREQVKHTANIKPVNNMTILLNRNYVRPLLNDLLEKTAKDIKDTGIEIRYLDANFPFLDGFALLPHLSHNDGKKIDLSLVYENGEGKITTQPKSRSGYGVFEDPHSNEFDQIDKCISSGYIQYDYPKYLTLGSINQELEFSKKGTKQLLQSILKDKNLGKIFIEPHLKTRMNLKDDRIRYHGCRAVRHDDHIHIQLK